MKLSGKLFIHTDILLLTGLAIGGDNGAMEIGGIDHSVMKNVNGEPYIPGSSLKGKMRSLLEKARLDDILKTNKHDKGICTCGECDVCVIFGTSAAGSSGPTRLYVRDGFLRVDIKERMYNRGEGFEKLELDYTESKWENTIHRLTSEAKPRNIERIPAGAVFSTELVFNVFHEKDIERLLLVREGLSLLEDDYLGANGSRGYGQIRFENISVSMKSLRDYEKNLPKSVLTKAVEGLHRLDMPTIIRAVEKEMYFG